jgi:DNA-binding CsgD family transcriptional regulator
MPQICHGQAMTEILGRQVELAAIEEFLASGEISRTLVLEGEPGIGKTTIWRWAVHEAAGGGVTVLSAQPTEAEEKLAFVTLADLLAGAHDAIGTLPEPQKHALRIALLIEESDGRPLDERVVGTAFAGLLREIAEDGPVLLAIDDIQWADPASWASIRFALRRVDLRVSALLACRPGFNLETPAEKLVVGKLADDAIRRVVVGTGTGTLAGDDVKRIVDLAGGHPLYALEIVRNTVARRREDADSTIGVPPALADSVANRVRLLPAEAQHELLRLSAGGDGTELSATSLALAVEGGLVERTATAARYAHPLFASAVYEGATARERRAVHAELAAVTLDVEDRARHLAAAAEGPNDDVASAIDAAVVRARERGATGVAADLAAAALELTPADSVKHWERRLEAAARYHSVGNLRAARKLLGQALGDTPSGPRRAQVLLRLGVVLKDSVHFDLALERFREALEDVGDDAAERATIHANIAYVLQFTAGPAAAEADARRALELAEQAGDPALLAQCLAALARIDFWLGRGVQRSAIERAVELDRGGVDLQMDPRPSLLLASQLSAVGEHDEARALLARSLSDLRDRGKPLHAVLHRLSLLEHRAGDWATAEELAREALDEAWSAGERAWERFGLHALATVQAHRGKVDEANASIDACAQIADEIGESTFTVGCRELRGFLVLSQGDPAEAERQLAPAHAALRAMNVGEPSRYPYLSDEIEALILLGRIAEAEQWNDWLGERGASLDRAAAKATAARCRGLLFEASGLDAAPYFEESLAHHDLAGAPFDRARTLCAFGGYLRRRRSKASAFELLTEATAAFEGLGATLWAERARDELAQLGGRAPATGKLTPTERQIADRVASGRSNVEVARELYLSPKTVEWNLSKIYRKLSVRSRTELAAKLANQRR